MKRILISDHRQELISTLEVILKNWGYRALPTSDPGEFGTLLHELEPELIITGPSFLSEKGVAKTIVNSNAPIILVSEPNIEPPQVKIAEELM